MAEIVYNLYQAKSSLSRLVERAAAGEEIIIAKAGKPMAKLVAVAMLVAQAQLEGLTLVTNDRRLHAYDVAILPL